MFLRCSRIRHPNFETKLTVEASRLKMALVKLDVGDSLALRASGKVRELYTIDSKSLLFVATDRISAYDVIMENVCVSSFLA